MLPRVDAYLHAVPRSGAVPEELGPFTLFRSTTVWPYYARPWPGGGPGGPRDVERVRRRCTALGIPLSVEWVVETAPWVEAAVADAGLAVTRHPLLVLERDGFTPVDPPRGVELRVLPPDQQALVMAAAVAEVGFGAPGTDRGEAGTQAREAAAARTPADRAAVFTARARAGVTVTVAAFDAEAGMVASGQHQPVGTVTEVVGVATLPSARRRGLAAAVTSELVRHAFGTGVDLVLLSAEGDAVARVYERVGFRRIGFAAEAHPAR
jgi:ribosomal protein S18 acetylase RimI-like enzyme